MEVNKHPLKTSSKKQPYLISDSAISLISLEQGKLSRYQLLHGCGKLQEFELSDE
jgi:hypothetical protein